MCVILKVTFVGVVSVLAGFFIIGLIYAGVIWLMEKFMGTTVTSRSGMGSAVRNNFYEEMYFKEAQEKNPQLVARAIENCKRKNYSLTYTNINSEITKIEKQDLKLKEKELKNKELGTGIKTNKRGAQLDELERISKLYDNNIISHDELLTLKKDVLTK